MKGIKLASDISSQLGELKNQIKELKKEISNLESIVNDKIKKGGENEGDSAIK